MKLAQFKLALAAGLILSMFPRRSLTQVNSYPVNSRSIFLTGCLLDKPPNFSSEGEVYQRLKTCVCMLDKFQANYSNQEFTELFDAASQNKQPQKQELDKFTTSIIPECF